MCAWKRPGGWPGLASEPCSRSKRLQTNRRVLVTTFSTAFFKGAPTARQPGRVPGQDQAVRHAMSPGKLRDGGGEVSARELGGSAGQLADPWAAAKPRPTGGSPPGAPPPPVGRPAPAAGRTLADTPPRRPRARKADRAVRLAPGILSPRKITIKGAPAGASPQAGQILDTDLSRQDPGTYQTDGPDSTRPSLCAACLARSMMDVGRPDQRD